MIGNPLSVEDIIGELKNGGIRIPEIQRGYVWKRAQVAKLLDSLYQDLPTGSLLLWDAPDGLILRDLKTNLGAKTKSDFPPKIVLDGQQRITSLGRVFDPKTPRAERIIFNVLSEIFEPYSPRNSADPTWIDVTNLLTDGVNELDVMDNLVEAGVLANGDQETRKLIHDRLKRLTGIRKYKYPVELVREDDLEVVTEVFIRVNSGGTRLREAELALARLAWKLPGSIVGPFEAMQDECVERGFDIDTRFLMRTLIAVATGQSRFRDLKAFWERPAHLIETEWKHAARGLALALDFVEGNVGIPGTALLTSQFSLIPLEVVFARRTHLSDEEERLLRRWFLLANTFSHYVGPGEMKLNQDLTALGREGANIAHLIEQLLRDLRGQLTISPTDLERAGVNSPFFPLAYLVATRNHALDWFTGIKLRPDNFAMDQNIEFHHIFPRKLLDAQGGERYRRDEMANLAFLGQKAIRKIQAQEPYIYLAPIAEDAPERLTAQFVPMDSELWRLDRFDDFLSARRQALGAAMNHLLEG